MPLHKLRNCIISISDNSENSVPDETMSDRLSIALDNSVTSNNSLDFYEEIVIALMTLTTAFKETQLMKESCALLFCLQKNFLVS